MLGACTSPGTREMPAVARAQVVDGEPSPSGGIEDAVLLLRVMLDEGELVCSSSLVAPNLVVTARHCVSDFVEGKFKCTVQGELVSTDPDAGKLGSHFDASTIEFYDGHTPRKHPVAYGAEVLSTLSETICMNDLAFVVLDRDLDLPVLPMRMRGRARLGEAVTLVGYGFDNAMTSGDYLDVETQERTHNANLRIDDVGPLENDAVTSAPPRTIVLQRPSGCVGDSGGPLLARETHALLGVDSLSDGADCLYPKVRNFFTHVPDFSLLIADAFDAAGYEPTPEPSVEPAPDMSDAGRGGAPDDQAPGGSPGAGGDAPPSSGGSPATSGSGPEPSHDTGGAPGDATAGAPGKEGGMADATSAGGNTAGPATHKQSSHHERGCAVTPHAAPLRTSWPLAVLMSVLEGILGIRRRARFVRLLRARGSRSRLPG